MRYTYLHQCVNADCRPAGIEAYMPSFLAKCGESTTEVITCPWCKDDMKKIGLAATTTPAGLQNYSTTAANVACPVNSCEHTYGLNEAVTTVETSWSMDAVANIAAGDILCIEGGEFVRVTAKGTTTVTVVRTFGIVAANVISSTATITKIASGKYIARQKAATGIGASTTALTMTLDAAYTAFSVEVGDLIRCESEILEVTAISTSALTVTRGVHNTTRLAHSTTAAVVLFAKHDGELIPTPVM